jgi:hypothetical protein
VIPVLAATLWQGEQEETNPPFLWITLKITLAEGEFFLCFKRFPPNAYFLGANARGCFKRVFFITSRQIIDLFTYCLHWRSPVE